MPNYTLPEDAILPAPIEVESNAFRFMFEVDENGKCWLKHTDAMWRQYRDTTRRYWKYELCEALKGGSLEDYATACKVFKLDLRELLSAESPEQTPRPPASQ